MNQYIEWSKNNHRTLKVGGMWAVPRSGLIFRKTPDGYELDSVMPYTDDMAMGAYLHADVPQSAEELRRYQREDLECIRRYSAFAGLKVSDPQGLLNNDLQDIGRRDKV